MKIRKGTTLMALLFAVLAFAQSSSAFYDANLGRWINCDPIGEEGGVNLYTFVLNDSVNLVDYYGLECGATFRRYPGGGGHQWISEGGNNTGFYPPGQWIDENQYAGAAGRPDPNDPNNYYEWDTKRKNNGNLPDGTPCSAATCQQIQDCIKEKAKNVPGTPKFNPLFNNCRIQSKDVAGDCCLEKGKKTNKPRAGRGGFGRSSDDSTYGLGFGLGTTR
jgi:hypothetical protein